MSELTLKSPYQYPLEPLVKAALAGELRLLQAGIRRTEERLNSFEAKHEMSTSEFIRRFENDEFEETLEFAEWIGEYRMLEVLQEKLKFLESIQFAN